MISLFDKIRFRLQDHCESGDCRKFCHECDFKTALRIVDEVEAEYGNGWIPCEKALPEEEGWYLVYTKPDKGYKSVNKAEFRKGFSGNGFKPYWSGAGGIWGNVVAWMPLPEGYKPQT